VSVRQSCVVAGAGRQTTPQLAGRSNPSAVRADQATTWAASELAVIDSTPGIVPLRVTLPTVKFIVTAREDDAST
jgi:hypothetical protein